MATQRYYGANYLAANYYSADWWATASGGERTGQIAATTALEGPGVPNGAYFGSAYWGSEYWSDAYWGLGSLGGGTTFYGTFAPADGVVGQIVASTDFTANLVGAISQVVLFDLEVGFSIQWQFSESSTYTGTVANTLDDSTASVVGQFSADSIGSIVAILGDASVNFDGTNTAPASRTGVITTDTQPVTANFDGVYIGAGGAIGTLSAILEGASSDLQGQYITSNTDGSIGIVLQDFPANWDGAFFDAGFRVGVISSTVTHTSNITATFEPFRSEPVNRRNRRTTRRGKVRTNTRR